MRFKYYLRGCGLGILLTAIVLTIGYHRNSQSDMSDFDVMERASELGMIMPDDTQTEETEEETVDTQETEAAATDQNLAATDDTQAQEETEETEESENSESAEETETSSSKNKKTKSDETGDDETDDGETEPETVTFTVKKGEYCRVIAENLYEQGLVDDAEAFRKYMNDSGYDNLIQVGSYELTTGMDYEEIAKIITTKNE